MNFLTISPVFTKSFILDCPSNNSSKEDKALAKTIFSCSISNTNYSDVFKADINSFQNSLHGLFFVIFFAILFNLEFYIVCFARSNKPSGTELYDTSLFSISSFMSSWKFAIKILSYFNPAYGIESNSILLMQSLIVLARS